MSRFDFTTDLRGLAGAANSATPVKDNIEDIETAGTVLGWENVEPNSLDADHVDTATALVAGYSDYSASGAVAISPSTTTILSHSVTCEVGAAIVVVANASTNTGGGTASFSIYLDAASVWSLVAGTRPSDYGGMVTVYAFEATSTSHTVDLVGQATGATTYINAHLNVLVFNR
jgi:hypothetical protein